MKKILAFCAPAAVLLEVLYLIFDHFGNIPDVLAYPWMFVSIGLMVVGVVYNSWCLGKRKNPFNFK